MSKKFHIVSLGDDSVLIIILSTEQTSAYWGELRHAVSKLNLPNVDIYFDFLYRNGLENRFFMSKLNNKSILGGRLRACDMAEKYKNMANMFFKSHIEILNGSALSNVHRNQYVRILRNL